MTELVDGRAIAAGCAVQTAAAAAALRARGITPTLAVLLPTDDAGAAWYVRSLQRAAARSGVGCQVHEERGPGIAARLAALSADPAVHGVICQAPLPAGTSLAAVCREAEVLVVAAGLPGLIGRDHVRPGAVVVDVGTSPADGGGMAGDVDAAAVTGIASVLTPVPGGVGPVTTAVLLRHTVEAAGAQPGPARPGR